MKTDGLENPLAEGGAWSGTMPKCVPVHPATIEHFRRLVAAYAAKSDAQHEMHRLRALHRNAVRMAAYYTATDWAQPVLRASCLASARVIRRWMRPWRRRLRKQR